MASFLDGHSSAPKLHTSKCLTHCKDGLVEVLLFSSLLTHLLRSLKSLSSKYEKLAAKLLRILHLPESGVQE